MPTYNTKFISGEPVSIGNKATGTITIANNALLPADWIQVGSSGQLVPGTHFTVGADAIATARNLRDRLNSPVDLGIIATSSDNVITLVAIYPGTAGNSIGLSAFSAKYTLSGANLTGGTDVAGTAFILDTAVSQTLSGAKLLSIKNAGVEKIYLDKDGVLQGGSGLGVNLIAKQPDTGSSISYILDQIPVLSAGGALLLSLRNNGTPRFEVDKTGFVVIGGTPGGYTPQPTAKLVVNGTLVEFGDGSGQIGLEFKSGNNGAYISDGSLFWMNFEKTAGAGRNQVRLNQQLTFSDNVGIINGQETNGNAGPGSPNLRLASLNTLATAGDRLVSFANNGVEVGYIEHDGTLYLGVDSTSSILKSRENDGATAVAFALDTVNTISNSAARLVSFKNASVEKLTIDKNGALRKVGELDVVSTTDYAEGAGYSKAWLQLVGSSQYWMLEAYKDSDSSDVFIDGLANGASSGMTMIIDGGTGNPGGSVKLQNYASGNYGGVGGKDLAFAFDPPTISGWASFIGLTGDGWFSGGAGATVAATKEWDFLSQARDDSDSNAYWFDTQFALTQPTAKLVVVANNFTEKFSIGINGGINVRRSSTATSVSSAGEVIIGVTDTTAVRTVTLDTDDLVNGRIVIVKDESGAAGTNNITVKTEGGAGCTIDGVSGATGVAISANYGCLRLYSDGTNWFTW